MLKNSYYLILNSLKNSYYLILNSLKNSYYLILNSLKNSYYLDYNGDNTINKIIFITGTPGVGKTTIANELHTVLSKKHDSKLIKINDLAIENNLVQGEDLEKGYKIIDIEGLSKKLNEVIDSFFNGNSSSETSDNFKIAIVEGHLSHLCNLNDINCNADFKAVVLRLNPKILQKRLQLRNYSEEKIHENLEAEALGVCSVEAYENCGKNVNEIDTSNLEIKNVLEIVEEILFDKKEFPIGDIDFMQWILE